MGKRFKGKESVYSYDNVDARVRVYETPEGKLEKFVLIVGKKNIILTPAEMAIASRIAQDYVSSIAAASSGYIAHDETVEKIRREVFQRYVQPKPKDANGYGSWKIPAIKEYRHIARAGLKEAKEAVEYMEAFGFEKWLSDVWYYFVDGNYRMLEAAAMRAREALQKVSRA